MNISEHSLLAVKNVMNEYKRFCIDILYIKLIFIFGKEITTTKSQLFKIFFIG